MKTTGIYPSLGRYFRTQTELADAACMSRTVLWRCLTGRQPFTVQQKQAIANSIIGKMVAEEIDSSDLNDIVEARQDFDKIFKTKE